MNACCSSRGGGLGGGGWVRVDFVGFAPVRGDRSCLFDFTLIRQHVDTEIG